MVFKEKYALADKPLGILEYLGHLGSCGTWGNSWEVPTRDALDTIRRV